MPYKNKEVKHERKYEFRSGFVELIPSSMKDYQRVRILCPKCGHKWQSHYRRYYTCYKCGYKWRDH